MAPIVPRHLILKLKRITKLIISFAYVAARSAKRLWDSAIRKETKGFCVAIVYHSVKEQERCSFRNQLEYVRRVASPIPADFFGPLCDGKHHVIVTFDDAFECLLENAIPELIRLEVPATIFVPTAYLGRQGGWDLLQPGCEDYGLRVMMKDDVKGLPDDLITVGSHSVRHSSLPLFSRESQHRELADSKETLEEIVSYPVDLIAFPHGEFDNVTVSLLEELGYRRAFSIEPEFYLGRLDHDLMGRVNVSPADWRLEFFLKIRGGYAWLSSWRRFRNWVSPGQRTNRAPKAEALCR